MGQNTLSIDHVGEQVRRVDRDLPRGWSLVGTIFDSVPVSEIQQNPPACIQSVFGFNGRYYIATDLTPGYGYWFNVKQNCHVSIASEGSGFRQTGALASSAHETPDAVSVMADVSDGGLSWRLPLVIGNAVGDPSNSRTLWLGFDHGATDGLDSELGEIEAPPLPPSQVFEARLQMGMTNGIYLDLRPAAAAEHEFKIGWQAGSGGYPVKLTWDAALIPDWLTLILYDNAGGKFIGPIDMSTRSALEIGSDLSFVTGVRIVGTISTAGSQITGNITSFDLRPNVPNPFGGMTTISYDVPHVSSVEVVIYDPSGRKVRLLATGIHKPGRHAVVWDGCDQGGAAVSPGVYFCRMDTDTFVGTRKLLVVR
jgi:hypothetical protein